MTEEIQYYDEELTALCTEIRERVDGLSRLSGDARQERIETLQVRMQRAKQVLHSFKVEMRELPSKEEALTYDAKCKEHVATLQRLNQDLQWAKDEGDRAELMGGRAQVSVENMSAQQLIAKGASTQQQSLASTDRSIQRIEESKQVGAETAIKLKEQTDHLRKIDEDIMQVESNLKRADLLLRAFLRRIATDKFVMVFLFLIVVGILTIIIYKAVNPEQAEEEGINVPDDITPPTDYKL